MPKEIITLNVEGMSCSHCVNAVKKSVSSLNGVESVIVDLKSGVVTVAYNPDRVMPDAVKNTIKDQGYDVK